MKTTHDSTPVAAPTGSERVPFLDDLNCLAHELESDCNYPFTTIRDAHGEAYTTKLQRLRDVIGAIDSLIEESCEMVALLRTCHGAVEAVIRAMRPGADPGCWLKLLRALEDSPALRPILSPNTNASDGRKEER